MRVGIVCDQPTIAECLRGAVTQGHEHEVVWMAAGGKGAAEHHTEAPAELVLLVIRREGMDGADATRRMMSAAPCPILLVAVEDASGRVFDAMGSGALDAIELPSLVSSTPMDSAQMLLRKIATLSSVIRGRRAAQRPEVVARGEAGVSGACEHLIAIGASAGGPGAVAAILTALPHDLPAAIVIVQHVDEQFTAGMASWLSQQSGFPVCVAAHGNRLVRGGVYLAGTGDHLVLTAPEVLGYTCEPRDCVYRPSIDIFFDSVSRQWHGQAIGVLLTGMGKDGAVGLRHLRDHGHYTIAQDEATSAVYGMPKAAAALDAAVEVLPIPVIARRLVDLVASGVHPRRRHAHGRVREGS